MQMLTEYPSLVRHFQDQLHLSGVPEFVLDLFVKVILPLAGFHLLTQMLSAVVVVALEGSQAFLVVAGDATMLTEAEPEGVILEVLVTEMFDAAE